jgi:hypothetical protein
MCAGVVVGTVAHAGNIRGSWDPQFNGTFTGVGFRGEIVFFVPDPCLSGTPGTTRYVSDGDSCPVDGPPVLPIADMSFVDADVELYDFFNQSNILSTINYGPPEVPSPVPDPILGILVTYDDNGVGTVIGLDTTPIGPQPSALVIDGADPPFPAFLFLQFSSGFLNSSPFSALRPGGAYLVPVSCTPIDDEGEGLCGADYDARSNRGVVTFAAPEPGSLALLLSAMGLGWLARRRMAAR